MVGLKPKIFMAGFVGMGLVSWAFYSAHIKPPMVYTTPELTVASSALSNERKVLAVVDSNNDGIEDWKEALQQTIPASYEAYPTSTYTPPETLTDQAGIALVQGLITARGMGPVGKSDATLVHDLAQTVLSQAESKETYTKNDIRVTTGADRASFHAYGTNVVTVILNHNLPEGTENEATILNNALATGNPEDLQDLELIAESYRSMLHDLKNVPVPKHFLEAHLLLLNAILAIKTDVEAMQEAFSDPLRTLARMYRYESDGENFYLALKNLFTLLKDETISWEEEDGDIAMFMALFE